MSIEDETMNEDRKQILEMLSSGRITADEAERLMAALDGAPASSPAPKGMPKYLRVQIEADDRHGGDTMTKVNIRVPLALLRAGVKLKSLLPEDARDQVNEAMREKGMDFDINQIKPENLDALLETLKDFSIDIDKKKRDARIKFFCE
jgi:hypothetical protein